MIRKFDYLLKRRLIDSLTGEQKWLQFLKSHSLITSPRRSPDTKACKLFSKIKAIG
eukprot:UN09902